MPSIALKRPADTSHATAGIKGEQATAAVLDAHVDAHPGVAVLHDLHIPKPGMLANIDHAVVTGSTVFLMDSKWWKPGRYWRLGSRAYRGFERFTPAETQTLPMGQEAYQRFLHEMFNQNESPMREVGPVQVWAARPLLVVWGADEQAAKVNGLWWGKDGKKAYPVPGQSLTAWLRKNATYPADLRIVDAMRTMLVL
jgi:hypothetical protein